ncbi:MAG TPA: hypothetical protein VGG99_09535 [Acetobacteraceae bacterium]|jgi:hypothetical protein
MCMFCDYPQQQQAGISPALAARARRIEARWSGECVPEEAWRIFLGHSSGAIAWQYTQRILTALDEASASPSALLRCDAVGSPADADLRRAAG